MDPERARIQDDLRGQLAGDVRCDDLFLEMYSSDASVYQVRPLGVVRPRNRDDVVACVQFAAENEIPLHARGAGTGLAGESLGPGLIVDFSRYMRRVVRVDDETVQVQPGVVLNMLNEQLRGMGRMFGPDPAMSDVTTMGSVVAIDASGSHWLRYGSARRHVKSLEVVLSTGEVVELARHAVPLSGAAGDAASVGSTATGESTTDGGAASSGGGSSAAALPSAAARSATLSSATSAEANTVASIAGRLARIITDKWEMICANRPKSLVNRSGYVLDDVLADGQIDLARLLVGSEGTLALTTQATLATQPIPAHRGAVLLLFDSLDSASRAVLEILPFEPSACDLMDRRHLTLARESDVRYELLLPAGAEAVLLVEQDGESNQQVIERLDEIVAHVARKKRLAGGARIALDDEDVDLYWQLARRFVPTLYRLKGSSRPLPFIEDVAVPPEVLPDFLVRLQNVLKQNEVTASLFAHAGHGQLHVRPFLDLENADDVRRMRNLADDLYRDVLDVGGTISGEHGDGMSRTPYLERQYGELCDVFRDVKHVFDPQGIFNPGKIVPTRRTLITNHLRPVAYRTGGNGAPSIKRSVAANGKKTANGRAAAENMQCTGPAEVVEDLQTDSDNASVNRPTIELQLNWDAEEMASAARNCNGCGACRAQGLGVRMCPIFRFAPREEASPRAKANLVRGVLSGQLDLDILQRDEFKEIADLCVHCHQCRLECPASVDIPKLMAEAKGAYVQNNGMQPSDWLLARIDLVSSIASRFCGVVNWAIANREARWCLEKMLGIAQGRKLPRLAHRTFMQRAGRRRLTRTTRHSGERVVYFVDTFANYYDPQLAEALVAVLQHNSVAVYVPPAQWHAGMPMIAVGALEQARRVAAHNVAVLAEAVRQGYTVVATEPSAVLCLTHEYLQLLGEDDDALLVAENTQEAGHYLWRLHQKGTLQLDFHRQNVKLAYHAPCHLTALGIGAPGENLLRLIPGVQVARVERGCSGMAGTYGMKRKNYRNSLRAGWGLISTLRQSHYQAGTTECSTCKMQMEQGVSKPTVHPIKMLALAYGLMPEIGALLTTPGEELVVT